MTCRVDRARTALDFAGVERDSLRDCDSAGINGATSQLYAKGDGPQLHPPSETQSTLWHETLHARWHGFQPVLAAQKHGLRNPCHGGPCNFNPESFRTRTFRANPGNARARK